MAARPALSRRSGCRRRTESDCHEEVRRTVVIEPVIVKRAELPDKGADAVGCLRTERAAVQERIAPLKGDRRQIAAAGKRAAADLRHAGGDIDLLQVVVVVKRPLTDGFQALRQHDLAQRRVRLGAPVVAVVERVVRDVGHGVRQLFLPERVCRRQQRQQQGKQSSFHGVLRMQAYFLSQD